MFLVENQPDEEHDEEIETPDEEKENFFSSFLVEFLNSFLDEKHTHNRSPQQKSSPTKFLDGFYRGKRSCVRGLTDDLYFSLGSATSAIFSWSSSSWASFLFGHWVTTDELLSMPIIPAPSFLSAVGSVQRKKKGLQQKHYLLEFH